MKNLAFVSLIIVLLFGTSCASSIKSGCGQSETVRLSRSDIPPMLSVTDSLQKFDIEISFMGKSLNGMFLIKKQANGTARMLINSYFGMSIMDFELSADTFVVHYMLEAMNKPAIVNLFKNDFRLLFGYNIPSKFVATKSDCKVAEKLIITKIDGKKYTYRINIENSAILEIKAPGINTKILSDTFPRTINLRHSGIFTPRIVIKEME
ncbi:MAG: hypothetical protein Q4G63_08750 [Bacteroidia bacterium]|nr:hypothetical protein [Bacteroidia bacterium]